MIIIVIIIKTVLPVLKEKMITINILRTVCEFLGSEMKASENKGSPKTP